jgi:hypothetical protein
MKDHLLFIQKITSVSYNATMQVIVHNKSIEVVELYIDCNCILHSFAIIPTILLFYQIKHATTFG